MKRLVPLTVFCLSILWVSFAYAQVGNIAGTVYYDGGESKLIYIGAFDQPCHMNTGEPDYGTEITGPGDYTIQFVYMGQYYVCAFMDIDDSGPVPNPAVDPQGAFPGLVTVEPGGITTDGIDIVLYDPNPIPTLTQSGGLALVLLLCGAALFAAWRRKRVD